MGGRYRYPSTAGAGDTEAKWGSSGLIQQRGLQGVTPSSEGLVLVVLQPAGQVPPGAAIAVAADLVVAEAQATQQTGWDLS